MARQAVRPLAGAQIIIHGCVEPRGSSEQHDKPRTSLKTHTHTQAAHEHLGAIWAPDFTLIVCNTGTQLTLETGNEKPVTVTGLGFLPDDAVKQNLAAKNWFCTIYMI